MTLYNNGLFIFTRDLRLHDNNGLNHAIKSCRNIYTAFFFTPEQVSTSNHYKSNNAVQFMIESLASLNKEIESKNGKLIILYGKPEDCLASIFSTKDIDAVFINSDVTKYSKKRFDNLNHICSINNKQLIETNDYYLSEPGSIKNTSGNIYVKFTPYYNKVVSLIKSKSLVINRPFTPSNLKLAYTNSTSHNVKQITLTDAMKRFGGLKSTKRIIIGGRENALRIISTIGSRVSNYEATRNDLSDRTTQLSAYIKFGNVSIREVYYAFRDKLDSESAGSLIRQLFWRDFYAQIMNNTPDVLFKPMKSQYSQIKWSNSTRLLDAWKNGTTGFPIVDAGMREMLASGYMHNRARLICGSFLPKTLLINWQKGEEHFARTLVDYDPASNNGNWQWVAGTGADSQPYFRILNPFLQSKKYDNDAEYIKRWIPELREVPAEHIHQWDKMHSHYTDVEYPSPIVDYSAQKDKVLKAYAAVV